MSIHASLTGADLHESKGVASASANTIAVADGAGSTTFKKITTSEIDTTSIHSVNTRYFTGYVPDISTSGSFVLLGLPDNCTITSIEYTLEKGITVADGSVRATNPVSGTISTTTITQSGSVEGSTFNASGLVNTTVTGPSYIKIASLGGSTTAAKLYVTVKVTLT